MDSCIGIAEGSFELALMYLKNGSKLQRKGWNGKGMFVYMVPRGVYDTCTEAARKEFGKKFNMNHILQLKMLKEPLTHGLQALAIY